MILLPALKKPVSIAAELEQRSASHFHWAKSSEYVTQVNGPALVTIFGPKYI
jgi:hypothetical protein